MERPSSMKIIVDAMGGDNAPAEIIKGALQAAEDLKVDILLVGCGELILKTMEENGIKSLPKRVEIAHASEIIDMEDNPATAFKDKKDSSMSVGLTLLRDGKGDAFVSAGSTGALLSAATLITKRIRGIRRAAMAPVVPTGGGGTILIDCGANLECTPEYLLQFAFMGSYYASHILGRPEPRVGLLNIGTEESKGGALQKEAFTLLEKAGKEQKINFLGNVESRDVMMGAVDVAVTDGFTGNVMLKTVEGTGLFFAGKLKKMFKKNAATKLAALMVMGGMAELKKLMDYREIGGTALLGISKPVIKAHGSSDAYAIRNAIRQAQQFASSGLIEDIQENIGYMRLSGAGE